MGLKFCPKCGAKLEGDSSFCSFCGADLKDREGKPSEQPIPKEQVPQPRPPVPRPQATQYPITQTNDASKYADFLPRLVAYIIDIIIVSIISLVISLLFLRFNLFLWGIIQFVIALLYFWILEAMNKGQTIGKAIMHLRTVDEQTLEPATLGNYFINNLLKGYWILFIIDFLIGVISNSRDPKKRLRIMQNASNTVVIKT
ncbi:MAG: zinc-ribbon domain-containing protein [Candidatus Lokiarchaeota archaeon]|nr:zinc-ribbon domain-containing protein [Candidatus Lokiarchaeota archaeon]MBD3337855.1 zinc-ribbon domain-containing protein [Candidatus Lokiarchaeota archaeon]